MTDWFGGGSGAMLDDLRAAFSKLPPEQKAMFLARVAHNLTVDARTAYVKDYDHPDGVLLREYNEFVHKVTGYIPHVLDGSEMVGQDDSVMAMIFELYGAGNRARQKRLADWLHVAE
jgi:hypothetical protein